MTSPTPRPSVRKPITTITMVNLLLLFALASVSAFSTTNNRIDSKSTTTPSFLLEPFTASACDNVNRPPSLNVLVRSLEQLLQTKNDVPSTLHDFRGVVVDHATTGTVVSVAHAIAHTELMGAAPITPLAVYCIGAAYGKLLLRENKKGNDQLRVLIGHDSRSHNIRLADALVRGLQSQNVQLVDYAGLATTPGIATLAATHNFHLSCMITASHLPVTHNGFKIYLQHELCLSNVLHEALQVLENLYLLPPASPGAVPVPHQAQYMEHYAQYLQQKCFCANTDNPTPLKGLNLVLHTGHGTGGFFGNVLRDLGAQVTGVGIAPDASFPLGIPNPESERMLNQTIQACQDVQADLGIMLDTDADRCGFVMRDQSGYQA